MLAKMGFGNITVWDFDVVSVENMNAQGYRFKDIGKPKVLALQEIVKEFSNIQIKVNNRAYAGEKLSGIIIACVDSMNVRQIIFENNNHVKCDYIIDSRMGAEQAILYAIKPFFKEDIGMYQKTLYTDKEAVAEACTAKATSYTASLLSGLVTKAVKDIAMGKNPTRIIHWHIGENQYKLYDGTK